MGFIILTSSPLRLQANMRVNSHPHVATKHTHVHAFPFIKMRMSTPSFMCTAARSQRGTYSLKPQCPFSLCGHWRGWKLVFSFPKLWKGSKGMSTCNISTQYMWKCADQEDSKIGDTFCCVWQLSDGWITLTLQCLIWCKTHDYYHSEQALLMAFHGSLG